MTVSKMYLVFILFAFISISQALAQPPRGERGRGGADPEQMAERQTEMMKDSLSLSTAQAEKVGEVNLKYAKQMIEIRQNANRDFVAMKSQMQELRDNQNIELKQYLTEVQFADLVKIQEDQSGKGKERVKDGRGNSSRSKKKVDDE